MLPSGLVAITDNAEPRMNVQFYDAGSGELVCETPVFSAAESASDNSLVAVGEASIVVENNYGYDSPLTTTLGRATPGGLARVDACVELLGGERECQVAWTSDEIAPTSVAKVSLENGLVYAYTTRSSRWGVQAWYVTAIDAATGETRLSRADRHGLDVQQPLRGGHAGARRLALHPDAGRDGAAPRRLGTGLRCVGFLIRGQGR